MMKEKKEMDPIKMINICVTGEPSIERTTYLTGEITVLYLVKNLCPEHIKTSFNSTATSTIKLKIK